MIKRKKIIAEKNQLIKEKEKIIAEKNKLIVIRDELITENHKLINDKNTTEEEKEKLRDKNKELEKEMYWKFKNLLKIIMKKIPYHITLRKVKPKLVNFKTLLKG
ncbi:hypothetical protein [Spiroplasma endosymbiont of Nephrotoma flavescens]|uniref:hypothetical protein n=1 Tax=Spiroplasma endosymbiont of Nephrotoma flavescens TaxID=3066302 RepID=UPI00313F19B8